MDRIPCETCEPGDHLVASMTCPRCMPAPPTAADVADLRAELAGEREARVAADTAFDAMRADLDRVTAERDRALQERDTALLGQCSASLADVQRLARDLATERARAEAAERRAAGLEAALREIATWWENWMPDNTVEEGGLDALDAARAALADPASALAAHDAETRRAALREISGAVVAAQARERQRTMPHPLEAAPPAALRWLAEACKRALAEDK